MKKFILLLLLGFCKTSEYTSIKKIANENQKQYQEAQRLLNIAYKNYEKKNFDKSIESAKNSLNHYVTFDAYYLIGLSYFQFNQLQESLSYLEKAESIKPDNQQLLLTLGLIYTHLAEYKLAIQKFEKLVNLYPNDSIYHYRLGLAYKASKEYPKAIEHLEKANKYDFAFKENVLLNLADIYFELKDYEKSNYYYDELKKLKPDSEEVKVSSENVKIAALIQKGNDFFNKRMYREAEENYKRIIINYPSEKVGYVQLGLLQYHLGRNKDAIQNFQKALSLSKDKETFQLLCRSYLESQMFSETKECLQKGLEHYETDLGLLNLQSLYYKKLGDRKLSYSILNKILLKEPKNLNANKNLYLMYLEDGKVNQAKNLLNLLKEIDKENLDLWGKEEKRLQAYELVNFGNESLNKKQLNQAKSYFQKALSLHEDSITHIEMGNFFERIKNFHQAEKHYLVAKRLERNNIRVYETLLTFYKQSGNQRKYDDVEKEIIQNSQSNVSFGILYGVLMIEKKDFQSAISYFERLKKRYPGNSLINEKIAFCYYNLALNANQKKDFQNALVYIKKAIDREPRNQLYRDSLEIIIDNQKHAKYILQLEEAEELFQNEEFDRAQNIYQNIYNHWEKPLILVRLAEIEFEKGNVSSGRKYLENALRDQPKEIVFKEALYSRLIEEKKYEEAEKGFLDIIKTHPDAYFSYYKLGVISLFKKQYNKSLEYFDDAILFNSSFLPSFIAKGVALYQLNKESEAIQLFDSVSKKEGFGKEIAFLNLALININKGAYKNAQKELQKLIQMFPSYSDAYYYLAYLDYLDKRFDSAENLLQKAIDLKKSDLYYWALIKVYQEVPHRKNEFRTTIAYFLQNFNRSSYYENVKDLYKKFNDSFYYLENSYRGNLNYWNVLPVRDFLLFYNNKELVLVKANSERVIYRKFFSNIVEVKTLSMLYVLEKNKISFFETLTGNLVGQENTAKQNCKIIYQNNELWVLQSSHDCKKMDTLYNFSKKISYSLNYNDLFIDNLYVYLLTSNQIFRISLSEMDLGLKDTKSEITEQDVMKVKFLELPKDFQNVYYRGGKFLIISNRNLTIYDSKPQKILEKNIEDIAFSLKENHLVLLEKSKGSLEIVDLETMNIEKPIFREPLDRIENFYYLGKSQYLFIDNAFYLNYWKENQLVYRKNLNEYLDGIFSFYY